MDVFHQSPNRVTVYMKPQQQISSPSGTQKEKGTKIDLQQAQEDDKSLSTDLSWVKTEKNTKVQSFTASQETFGLSGTILSPSKS